MTWEALNAAAMILGYVAMLGLIVLVAMVAYLLVDEARRSYRQCRRIERVALGKGKRVPWRVFLLSWCKEYFTSYTSLRYRGYVLPHDPRKPVRRGW
ncbi:hypothetical protein [Hyphomicrobium sp. ghe19]|uniref:hypothetical protein n=1 Tax=Hyphomicrobium sp. ghe19 TaxID=2682968 RepID=UPI00136775F4|nr:hypothetical protein HYPP_01957 [Hyphomicrobium sp. ghe19]